MFVGGEFYEDHSWSTPTPSLPIQNACFLNGGRACLTIIAQYLCANKTSRILLPSYLCPSILDVLERCGLTYDFYKVTEDFSIDLDDLRHKAEKFKAVYFINYFGFQHSAETLNTFKQLQKNNILIVEDNAQAVFSSVSTGDFIFNSMRKLCANDGGYMTTRINLSPFIDAAPNLPNRRLPLIREYRRLLPAYLYEGRGRRSTLEKLFYQAENFYESDGVIHGDPLEKEAIEKQDWQAIKAVRRSNYQYLLELIADLPGVKPVYPALQADNMPLGLPVYISGTARDQVNERLADEGISLVIHWDALLENPRTRVNPLTVKMAGSLLTLTIDQYINPAQLEYLAMNLAKAITTR